MPLLRLDETLIAVSIIRAETLAVGLSTILAVLDDVVLVTHDVIPHLAVHTLYSVS